MQIQEATLELVPQSEELPEKRADIPAIWQGFRSQAEKLKLTAETLVVTDVSQKAEMKLARATRLELRQLRIAVEAKRKELGDEALRQKQRIDGDARILKELIEPLEERLLEQEQFAERKEAERIASLIADRKNQLSAYINDTSGFNLGEMTEEAFIALHDSLKASHKAKLAEAARVEAERIAKEKAEAEERERIRLENERLKKEAAERELAAKKEREAAAAALAEQKRIADEKAAAERKRVEAEQAAAEAKAKKEREAAEEAARKERAQLEAIAAEERAKAEAARIEAEKAAAALRAQKEAEARIKAKQEAEAKAAAAAPDKAKLAALADNVRALAMPKIQNEEIAGTIIEKIEAFAKWIEAQAAKL